MKIILIALLRFLQISTVMGQTNDFTEEMNNPKNHTVESYLKASRGRRTFRFVYPKSHQKSGGCGGRFSVASFLLLITLIFVDKVKLTEGY